MSSFRQCKCGGEKDIRVWLSDKEFSVECVECGCSTKYQPIPDDPTELLAAAAAAWQKMQEEI